MARGLPTALLLFFSFGSLQVVWGQEGFSDSQVLLVGIQEAKSSSVFVTAIFQVRDDAERVHEIRKSGTGFIIDTAAAPALRVVTNRHVVTRDGHAATQVLVKVNIRGATEPALFEASVAGVHNRYDLAILTLNGPYHLAGNIELKRTGEDRRYFELGVKAFEVEKHFASDENIKEGVSIYSIGYPLTLGIGEPENYPVVRKGIVAQTIPSSPIFLIDGIVNPGSSGSPVISLVDGSVKLLGMVQGYYPYQEPGRPDVSNSGLSITIPASVIRSYITQLIQAGKLKAEW